MDLIGWSSSHTHLAQAKTSGLSRVCDVLIVGGDATGKPLSFCSDKDKGIRAKASVRTLSISRRAWLSHLTPRIPRTVALGGEHDSMAHPPVGKSW
jgi:hypothetical protein